MALNAWFRIQGDPFPESFDLLVTSSDPDELFMAAIVRAYDAEPEPHSAQDIQVSDWYPLWIWIGGDPDDDVHLEWDPGRTLTVGQVEVFLGPAHGGPPPQIALAFYGRGGDGFARRATIAAAAAGAMAGDPTALLLAGAIEAERRTVARKNRQYRELYEDWRDAGFGPVPMPLEQAVRSEAVWEHETFKRRFNASDDGASELLRRLGYLPWRDEQGRRHWRDMTN